MVAAIVGTAAAVQLSFVFAAAWFFPWREFWEGTEYAEEGRFGSCVMVFCALLLLGPLFYFCNSEDDVRW